MRQLKWTMNDWMKNVRSPIRYRVNQTVSLKLTSKPVVMSIAIASVVFFVFWLLRHHSPSPGTIHQHSHLLFRNQPITYNVFDDLRDKKYNLVYPLSQPFYDRQKDSITFRIAAIADLDTKSKKSSTRFVSYLLRGTLTLTGKQGMQKATIKLG
jgi:hypothetical protein